MTISRLSRKAGVALLLVCALLLSGCAGAGKPQEAAEIDPAAAETFNGSPVETLAPMRDSTAGITFPVNPPTGADNEIAVSTVDEFLAAIGSDRTIYLKAGDYTLTEAGDYGSPDARGNYYWAEVNDGFALVITGVQNLRILGYSANDVEINTVPRYANVLTFSGCENISVQGVTAGHSDGPGQCAGAVLYFDSSKGASVIESDLYGCGTLGVEALDCHDLLVENCVIRECSRGGVAVQRSKNVQLRSSQIVYCGQRSGSPAYAMLTFTQSEAVAVIDCTVETNFCQRLLESNYSRDVQILGSYMHNNIVNQAVFAAQQYSPVVEGCAFDQNTINAWYIGETEPILDAKAISRTGEALSEEALVAMQRADVPYEAPAAEAAASTGDAISAGGAAAGGETRRVEASTVDEFLAAIASNTTVFLADGNYDLFEATGYGATGGEHYYWFAEFDGPGLVIDGVSNFHIVGGDKKNVVINAIPRYANVLSYADCENVSLTGVTLGHTAAPGECTGGVLRFDRTNTVLIQECGLYGCGILGVDAVDSSNFLIDDTDIYDCSHGAASFFHCSDVSFTGGSIRDCGEKPWITAMESDNVTRDGEPLGEPQYDGVSPTPTPKMG